jgi:hypothetical protein
MIGLCSGIYRRYCDRDTFWLIVIGACCALVMLPLLYLGLPEAYDAPQHLRFAATFRDALRSGDLFPAWGSGDNYGFGSVGIRVYPPLADYLLGASDILLNNLYAGFLLNAFMWMFPGAIGTYYWAKEFLGSSRSALAAVFFALMPYHLIQIYQYTLFSEFAAASILPFCFWFLTRLIRRDSPVDVLLLSVSFSLLILTHLPTIITGSIALGTYGIFLIDLRTWIPVFKRLLFAGSLSLLATMFYWIRLVTEMGWLRHNTEENWTRLYDYHGFLFPIFYNMPESVYLQRTLWMLDIAATISILFMVPLAVYFLFRLRTINTENAINRFHLAIVASGIVLIFLLSTPARYLWETLPVLHKIQFPWRFLSPLSLIGAVAFVIAISLIHVKFPKLKRLVSYPVMALVLIVVLFDVTQIIVPSLPMTYERFQAEYGDLNNSEGCDCWWPIWAQRSAFDNKERVSVPGRSVQMGLWDREERTFQVSGGSEGDARVATFYYPYWRAIVNGIDQPPKPGNDGAIQISLGQEDSTVSLRFVEPWFLSVAAYVSAITWIILGAGFMKLYRRRRNMRLEFAVVS